MSDVLLFTVISLISRVHSLCQQASSNKKTLKKLGERINDLTDTIKKLGELDAKETIGPLQRFLKFLEKIQQFISDLNKGGLINALKKTFKAQQYKSEIEDLKDDLNECRSDLNLCLSARAASGVEKGLSSLAQLRSELLQREKQQIEREKVEFAQLELDDLDEAEQELQRIKPENQQQSDEMKEIKGVLQQRKIISRQIITESKFNQLSVNSSSSSPSSSSDDDWHISPSEVEQGPLIGSGGSGSVYGCSYANSECALKMLRGDLNSAELIEIRFELSFMKRIQHPNIIRVFGANLVEKPLFIVMERCAKGSLYDLMQRNAVEMAHRVSILLDVAKALDFLHDKKHVLHRDVKSMNVLVRAEFSAALSDFGSAKAKPQNSEFATISTRHQGLVGSDRWLAPEILCSEHESPVYTTFSDIFAFGVLMFEAGSNSLPWANKSNGFIATQISKGQRPDSIQPLDSAHFPSQHAFSLFSQLMHQCWHQTPNDRPNAKQIIQQLNEIKRLCDNRNNISNNSISSTNTQQNHQSSSSSTSSPWSSSSTTASSSSSSSTHSSSSSTAAAAVRSDVAASSPSNSSVQPNISSLSIQSTPHIQQFNMNRPEFVRAWGREGEAGTLFKNHGKFKHPSGISIWNNLIFVCDYNNNRIQVFDLDGKFVRAWGCKGSGNGEFECPWGISISNNLIFVCDSSNNRIQVFDLDGEFVRAWGREGSGNGKFNQPRDISISNNLIFVCDWGNNRIQVFDLDGKFVRAWDSAGSDNGEFDGPTGISVSNNLIFVSDCGNHRIQVFDLNGKFVRRWGSEGRRNGQFQYPAGISISNNLIFVSDCENNRIQVFDWNGKFVRAWGSKGSGNGQFNCPTDISISNNLIFVSDTYNHRIQVFRLCFE